MGDLIIKMKKISVVMSCYNEQLDYFRESVNSILNQTFNDFEFIIILDNPKNLILEKEILKFKKLDNRIIFKKNKKNYGLAYSLNLGIKISRGKYIVRMDADDISKFNRLELQYNYLEKNKDVDLLFSFSNYINPNGKYLKSFEPSKLKVKNLKKYFFKEHLLVHPSLCCKREVLKNNLFDTSQIRSQDFELWIRLISKNYNFDLIKETLLDYRLLDNLDYYLRIKKDSQSYYYGFKALNKNFKKIILFDFWYFFYFKSLFFKIFYSIFILIFKFNKNNNF